MSNPVTKTTPYGEMNRDEKSVFIERVRAYRSRTGSTLLAAKLAVEANRDQPSELWLFRFLDNLDVADIYIGRLRIVLWFAMLTYIILHACGVLP